MQGSKQQLELNAEYSFSLRAREPSYSIGNPDWSFSAENPRAHRIEEGPVSIPLHILKSNSSMQAIVLYLKDHYNLSYAQIALMTNRDQRTIWCTYNKAKSKVKCDPSEGSSYLIPVSALSSRKLSVLESIVLHLKVTTTLSLKEISSMLGKSYTTIWTVYKRAIAKLGGDSR